MDDMKQREDETEDGEGDGGDEERRPLLLVATKGEVGVEMSVRSDMCERRGEHRGLITAGAAGMDRWGGGAMACSTAGSMGGGSPDDAGTVKNAVGGAALGDSRPSEDDGGTGGVHDSSEHFTSGITSSDADGGGRRQTEHPVDISRWPAHFSNEDSGDGSDLGVLVSLLQQQQGDASSPLSPAPIPTHDCHGVTDTATTSAARHNEQTTTDRSHHIANWDGGEGVGHRGWRRSGAGVGGTTSREWWVLLGAGSVAGTLSGVMGGLTGVDGPPTIFMFTALGAGGGAGHAVLCCCGCVACYAQFCRGFDIEIQSANQPTIQPTN